MAALGALAFKAYQDWQQAAGISASIPMTAATAFEQLPDTAQEEHSRAVLKALVAAAKADGHIDERERGLIETEIARLDADDALRAWLDTELRTPLDPADVARAARTPEMGVEMYLASLLAVDETNFMERSYLDELARQLGLDPTLKARLEKQIGSQPQAQVR